MRRSASSPEAARLVSWLVGYRVDEQYARTAGFALPIPADCPRLFPGTQVIDEFTLNEVLHESGVHEGLVDFAIGAIEGLGRVDGQLVDWTGSQVDRAKTVLQVRDEPQSLDELFELVGGSSMVSFRNRILDDEEIMRVSKTRVGLRVWGGTRYTTIVGLMMDRLASGPCTIEELGLELQETYEVSANSVSMYAAAPVFKVTGDTIALRGRHDPYIARDKPSTVPGLFVLSEEHLTWNVIVDTELLRGSGRSIPYEIGTFMGLEPGDSIEIACDDGSRIPMSWPETSHTGPQIGSLRSQVVGVGGSETDVVRLGFHPSDMRLSVDVVPPATAGESPSATVSRLTGVDVDRCHDLRALAEAIGVAESDVVAVLQKRREGLLARAAEQLCK